MSDTLDRVVIFGGAGFIGRHLTDYLNATKAPREIVLADLSPPSWDAPGNASYVEHDVRDVVPESFGAPELIINLAAVHRTPGHADHEYHDTNEHGAERVTEFATRTGTRRIWFTSSISVYGPDETEKTEASTPKPVSAYGKSKLAAEGIHTEWAESDDRNRLVIARPATVFGPGEGGNFTRLAGAMKRHFFVYPGRRDTLKACGYVRDLGRAFAHMEQFAAPVARFNFAYPEPPTIEEVCRTFAAVGGMSAPRVTVPAPVLLRTGAVLDKVGLHAFDPDRIVKLMHSTNVLGTALVDHGFEFEFDLRAAIEDWAQTPPEGEFV